MPAPTCRTTLYCSVTCSTTHHVQAPFWLRGEIRMAVPFCACAQLLVITLCSTSTLRACLSSRRFLTCQTVPRDEGVPAVPGAPVSTKDVALTFQYWSCAPGVRPYTRYSETPGTASHDSVMLAPAGAVTAISA